MPPAPAPLRSLAAAPDGTLVVGGDSAGRLHIWNNAGQLVESVAIGTQAIASLAFAPDSAAVLSVADGDALQLVAITSGALVGRGDAGGPVAWAAPEAAGSGLLLGREDGALLRYDPAQQTIRPVLPPSALAPGASRRFAYTQASNAPYVLVESIEASAAGEQAKAELQLYNLADTGVAKAIISIEHPAAIALSPDGGLIALGDQAGLQLISSADGSVVESLAIPQAAAIAFSPDGARLAVASFAGELWIVELEGGAPANGPFRVPTEEGAALAFSPDGNTVAVGGSDGTLLLVATRKTAEPVALAGYTRPIRSLAFSADGRSLAAGSNDPTVRIWDVASGVALRQFVDHSGVVAAVSFSGNGRLLSAGADGSIRLWHMEAAPAISAWARVHRWSPALPCSERITYRLGRCQS
jgi:WD40 repeat protein